MDPNSEHISIRVLIAYFEYVKKFYPLIDLNAVLKETELPLNYFSSDSNWTSISIVARMTDLFIEKTGDPNFVANNGRFGMSVESLGPWLFHFIRFTQTSGKIYHKMVSIFSVICKALEVSVEDVSQNQVYLRFKYIKVNLTAADASQLEKWQNFSVQNIKGYAEAIPTVLDLPLAEVTIRKQTSFGLDFSFELLCHFQNSNTLINKISGKQTDGKFYLLPLGAEFLTNLDFPQYQRISKLTLREAECLVHFLQGKTAKETASAMSLSARTVESHWEAIKGKLQCQSRSEVYDLILKRIKENGPVT